MPSGRAAPLALGAGARIGVVLASRGPRRTALKIALITSSYLPNVGGVEEHVRNVAAVLTDRGHRVTVWTVGPAARARTVAGVPVHDLPCPLPNRSAVGLSRFAVEFPRAAAAWWSAWRSDRPDVLHVHCFGPNGSYARWLRPFVRRPMVLSAHGETVADADGVFDTSALLRHSLRAGLTEAAAVTGCSEYALADLRARFGLPAEAGVVVFNGIEATEPAAEAWAAPGGRYLLAVGRVVATKGFDLLLQAFARAGLPADVRLVIGGDGPALGGLRAEAARLGLGERVVFTGRLERGEVVSAMRGTVALVVPSRVEPFGITVLEGWRAGVPVLATTRGGPPEFVTDGETGLLVDPTDVDALADRLRWVVEHPEQSAAIGRAGQERARAFSWDVVADAYERIYAEVVGPPT